MPEKSRTSARPAVVVVGGGTGSYTVLSGLRQLAVQLTAVVSMADDGGSSGRLRDEFGHLPPGDVRRCLVALSGDSSAVVRRLFEYRFERGNGLGGHSFGNLVLTALTELTGRTDLAITEAARLLGVRGDVVPVTLAGTCLCAEREDGSLLRGESRIDLQLVPSRARIRSVFLDPPAIANPAALAAISSADVVVIGPGDLYTSILPNLLVKGVPGAIKYSSAVKIYVCNLMTKRGETDGYRASDFVREVQRYLGSQTAIDHVIVNDPARFPAHLLQRYAEEHAFPVEPDLERCEELGVRPYLDELAAAGSLLRHDSTRLANGIMALARTATWAPNRELGPKPACRPNV
jgi:uncharacterized cofD-like protein